MMFKCTRLACVGFALSLAVAASAQTVPGGTDMPDASTLANALASLKSQVNDQNYGKFGFRNRGEVSSAMFGQPIRRYIIRPDKLRGFQAATDPATVLEDTRQWMYPVLTNGDVRCAVTIARRNPGGWKAIAFGDQGLSRVVVAARRDRAEASRPREELFFLVDVLSVNRKFVALRTDGNAPDSVPGRHSLVFTWLGTPPDAFPKEDTAERVLLYLAAEAKRITARRPG
jgi:hypothetical protein